MLLLVIHKGPHGLCPQGEDEGLVAVVLVMLYYHSHKEWHKVQIELRMDCISVFLFVFFFVPTTGSSCINTYSITAAPFKEMKDERGE